MKPSATPLNSESIRPAVHLEFIQNQLEHLGPSTPEQVEQYHRALFFHHHAPEWERHRQEVKTREDKLTFLEARLTEVRARLAERTKLVPVSVDGTEDVQPNAPWNVWDLCMCIVSCAGIAALMIFGVLNISFNLIESGLITFRESPLRAYLWAALLPIGALAVKVGWDFLESPLLRRRYVWICLLLGMAGVLVWVLAYACVYPTLSKGIDEHIAALSVFDRTAGSSTLNFAGAKWIDGVTVAAQAVAEIFLSALLGIYLTGLYARHRPVRLAADPAYHQWDQERLALDAAIARERSLLGEAKGQVMRLENQLAALIAYGVSIFHREAARREEESGKKRVILDQLSEHLRLQLAAFDAGGRLTQAPLENGGERGNGN